VFRLAIAEALPEAGVGVQWAPFPDFSDLSTAIGACSSLPVS
jgi:hypothetical protein